jgi:hypothetical protein
MERFVTVNDFSASNGGPERLDAGTPENLEWGFGGTSLGVESQPVGRGFGSPQRPDQGPCLYLGPRGQRCGNPAVFGGFCARHEPSALGGAKVASRGVSRVIAAGIGILAAMWPILADLLREVLRWIHSR